MQKNWLGYLKRVRLPTSCNPCRRKWLQYRLLYSSAVRSEKALSTGLARQDPGCACASCSSCSFMDEAIHSPTLGSLHSLRLLLPGIILFIQPTQPQCNCTQSGLVKQTDQDYSIYLFSLCCPSPELVWGMTIWDCWQKQGSLGQAACGGNPTPARSGHKQSLPLPWAVKEEFQTGSYCGFTSSSKLAQGRHEGHEPWDMHVVG